LEEPPRGGLSACSLELHGGPAFLSTQKFYQKLSIILTIFAAGEQNKMGNVYVLSDFMARSKHEKAGRLARDLTNRQREVATLVRERHSNKVIAKKLGLSEGTVKTHLHTIYSRLGVENRAGLVEAFDRP
jgi:DNA-binding CsgD family transcriptional regulator